VLQQFDVSRRIDKQFAWLQNVRFRYHGINTISDWQIWSESTFDEQFCYVSDAFIEQIDVFFHDLASYKFAIDVAGFDFSKRYIRHSNGSVML